MTNQKKKGSEVVKLYKWKTKKLISDEQEINVVSRRREEDLLHQWFEALD